MGHTRGLPPGPRLCRRVRVRNPAAGLHQTTPFQPPPVLPSSPRERLLHRRAQMHLREVPRCHHTRDPHADTIRCHTDSSGGQPAPPGSVRDKSNTGCTSPSGSDGLHTIVQGPCAIDRWPTTGDKSTSGCTSPDEKGQDSSTARIPSARGHCTIRQPPRPHRDHGEHSRDARHRSKGKGRIHKRKKHKQVGKTALPQLEVPKQIDG